MQQVVIPFHPEASPDITVKGKPEELAANVPVKHLLHIFEAVLALKSDVDQILIVTDRIQQQHRSL